MELKIRHLEEKDYLPLVQSADQWWGGRQVSHLFHRLFFVHFRPGSFVLEDEQGARLGFLIGFRSQTEPMQAYIHLVGVDPRQRGLGLGRRLYEQFFSTARDWGCTEIRCITTPQNHSSVAFHQRLGFQVVPGDAVLNDLPVTSNYDGHGGARVLFSKQLS